MDTAAGSLSGFVIGQLLLTLIIAIPLAFVTSLALLYLYRRAVKRGMMCNAATASANVTAQSIHRRKSQSGPPVPPPRVSEISIHDATGANAWPMYLYASAYLVAGIAFAIVITLSYLRASGFGFDWLAASFLVVTYAWPIVITLCLVATLSWSGVGGVLIAYGVILASIVAAMVTHTDVEATQVLKVWLNTNLEGSVLALIFLARPIRAVGPLVAVFMISAVAGALAIVAGVGRYDQALQLAAEIGTQLHLGPIGASALLLLTGAALAGVLGWFLLRFIGTLYRQRWISDQSILVDAVWLMFTIDYGIALTQTNSIWFLGAIAAFITYKLVSCAGFKLLNAAAEPDAKAPQLLLLRVFSLGARSERLFETFAKLWLYCGSIQMIAGPDLVTATVQPHQFLDFIAGRLNRNFIDRAETLERRLEDAEPIRDFDGRFRTTSFFCHDDTWQLALQKLAKGSEAVLMDLRGFTPANRGCLYEIEELLEVVDLDRVVFVIDQTTDEEFLDRAIADGWRKVTNASPNWGMIDRRAYIFPLDERLRRHITQLVASICRRRAPAA